MQLDRAVALAKLALAFSRVERVTFHEDGKRPETDSDHTVMLGLIACDFAPVWMDKGLVAQMALVHDIIEAKCGDVQTLVISDLERAAKKLREAEAHAEILAEFGATSWLGKCLIKYEAQALPEARYVRLLDKLMPKLTHMLNGCVAAKALTDYEGFCKAHAKQFAELHALYGQDPNLDLAVFALLAEAMRASEEAWGCP